MSANQQAWRLSAAKVEQQMLEANRALQQRILDDSNAMQTETLASMRLRVWLLAAVGWVYRLCLPPIPRGVIVKSGV